MKNNRSSNPAGSRLQRQIAHYDAGMSPERVARLFAERGESMRQNYVRQAALIRQVERRVAEVTDAEGVAGIERFWYSNYGRQVYRVWRKVPVSLREKELAILAFKWEQRGLAQELLERIATVVQQLLAEKGVPCAEEQSEAGL
ncbi:MAG: hypothetical protein ABIK43_03965 [candidate division WOR-3 bacterium]